MTESQQRALPWGLAGCYVLVFAAIAAGLAPIWCLGVVFALPPAVRVVRADSDVRAAALEFTVLFVGQVVLGFVIKGIVR